MLFLRVLELFVLAWEHVLSVFASLLWLCCEFEASPGGDIRWDFLEPSVEFVSWEAQSGELCELVLRLLCWLSFWLAMDAMLEPSPALDCCVMERVCMRSTLGPWLCVAFSICPDIGERE